MRTDKVIGHYASFVHGKPDPDFHYTADELEVIERHYGWKYLKQVGDPYNGKSRHIANQSSVFQELKKKGVYLDFEMEFPSSGSHVQDRVRKATLLLDKLDINRNTASEFYEFVQQAHYPREREGAEKTGEKVLPVHDDTSHYRTCLEYYAAIEHTIVPPEPKPTNADLEKKFAQLGI